MSEALPVPKGRKKDIVEGTFVPNPTGKKVVVKPAGQSYYKVLVQSEATDETGHSVPVCGELYIAKSLGFSPKRIELKREITPWERELLARDR
jgi:hypothetical protein